MFRWRHDSSGADSTVDATGWLDAPPEAWPGRILGGLLLPVVLLVLASGCIIFQEALIPGATWRRLTGVPAIALGVALIGVAVFAHAHAFWGPVRRLAVIREVGRIVGAILLILGLGYVIWSELWIG